MTSCSVCVEPFNGKRKCVECPYCQYQACAECAQRYLTSTYEEPHCMSCRRAWDIDVIARLFTKTFVNDGLRKHRRKVLLDRERSRLPEAMQIAASRITPRTLQAAAEATKQAIDNQFAPDEQLRESQLQNLRQRRSISAAHLHQCLRLAEYTALKTKLAFLRQCARFSLAAQRRLESSGTAPTGNDVDENDSDVGDSSAGARHRPQFTRPCPATNCRGFLDAQFVCAICNTHVCKTCHDLKPPSTADNAAEHVCNPDSVATAKMLNKDSRPCPKCGALIFRISGCNQMFCTAPDCNTAFDWATLRIINGRIHNPHYFEYLQRGGTVPQAAAAGEVRCNGNLMDTRALTQLLAGWAYGERHGNDDTHAEVMGVHRCAIHVEEEILRTRPIQEHWRAQQLGRDFLAPKSTLPDRVSYVLNELTEEMFERRLERIEQHNLAVNELRMVWEMFVQTVGYAEFAHLNVPCVGSRLTYAEYDLRVSQFRQEMQNLRLFVNECLQRIVNRYPIIRRHYCATGITDCWSTTLQFNATTTATQKKRKTTTAAAAKGKQQKQRASSSSISSSSSCDDQEDKSLVDTDADT